MGNMTTSPFLTTKDQRDSNYIPTTRKRSRDLSSVIECEVCRRNIGTGGIKPLDEVEYRIDDLDLSVEYVCLPCGAKYLFCSECGGGGKTRTGKWRPKELFDQGRRTCSLPHIRIGNAALECSIVNPKFELTYSLINELEDVFFDYALSFYAIPGFLESRLFGSFDAVKKDITREWIRSVVDILFEQQNPDKQHFLVMQWMDKIHRNKGKTKNPSKESTSWLRRIGFNVADQRYGLLPLTNGDIYSDRCYTAFAIAEWDIKKRTVFMTQIAPRSIFNRPTETYGELIKAAINEIHNESSHKNIDEPIYVWCWSRNDNTRARMIPEKLGFYPKDDFLIMHPHLPPNLFSRPHFQPLDEGDVTINIASVDEFLACASTK
jgi:hypothetical protein